MPLQRCATDWYVYSVFGHGGSWRWRADFDSEPDEESSIESKPALSPADQPSSGPGVFRRAPSRTTVLLVLVVLLGIICLLSLALGSRGVPLSTALDGILEFDPTNSDMVVVRQLRLPRTLIGLAVGVALGLAGTLMQGITRNPLADPGILGVTAGAGFAVALAVLVLEVGNVYTFVGYAFTGALVGTLITYGVASLGRGGPTPIKLAITGTAVTALFLALTTMVALRDMDALNALRFWNVGSLTGPNSQTLSQVWVFVFAGALIALASGRSLNALSLGEDVARALGMRVGVARTAALIAIVLLAGSATALAGPIFFLGLVIPHVARAVTGVDYRWILAYATVLGPILLLSTDILGRLIARPAEVQVGIVMAAIGGPAFVALVRRRKLAEL